ncbi:TPA: DUF554 family protein [Salmonella enterica]|nr:DUF554 family protein [Salmonella enterica]
MKPVGIFVCSGSLLVGAIIGASLNRFIPEHLKKTLPLIAGLIPISMGAFFLNKLVNLPPIALAGIFGALTEGMTGDATILITKSILDFFTAAIFASALGYIIAVIFVPQLIVFAILFFAASFIMTLLNPLMIADFTACGGIIMLATGFRLCGIRSFPTANMLPALILVMPFSTCWQQFVA